MSGEEHQFKIRGMDCAEEVAILKREIGPRVGGEQHLSFDLLKAKMTVLAPTLEVNPRGRTTRSVWSPRAFGSAVGELF